MNRSQNLTRWLNATFAGRACGMLLGALLCAPGWSGSAAAQDGDRVERSITVPRRGRPAPRVAQSPEAPIEFEVPPGAGPAPPVEFEPSEDFDFHYDYDEHCGLECNRCGGVGCDLYWASAEYLLYWADGMNVPALATTSPAGTPQDEAGVLGLPTTTILYGNDGILTDNRNGGRFTFGAWMDCCKKQGIEFEYFFLSQITERFQASGMGAPIIMRPFFNAVTNMEDAQIVSFPGQLGGTLTIDSESMIQGFGARVLLNVMENYHCPVDGCGHYSCGAACTRFDVLLGYRYIGLDESLNINENLTSLDTGAPGQFVVNDLFDTDNDFHGGEIGLQWGFRRNCWVVSLLGKVALGNNHEQVRIRGNTLITQPDGMGGNTTTDNVGGLLAQSTNIGDYSQDQFAVISELGATVKYQLSRNLLLTAGYTAIFWNDAVRPGAQIDTAVNPNLIPPPVLPLQGPARPVFAFREESLWIQGLRLGGELRW